MRKILMFLLFILIGCKSYKREETFSKNEVYSYVVPHRAEKILYEKMKNFDNVFLELSFNENGYSFFIIPTKKNDNEYFGYLKISNSNRKILVNSKLYDLVFSSDVTLGSKIDLSKAETISEQESGTRKNEDEGLIVNKKTPIYDRAILVSFDKDWNVIMKK
ncbi:hypothetical protein [Flavobacterium sp. PS2]|uniref:hypothetical protein n=1 Tax=Flavobacterium sp. PS2 TaxID=3384157 RepID=UPI00390C8F3D